MALAHCLRVGMMRSFVELFFQGAAGLPQGGRSATGIVGIIGRSLGGGLEFLMALVIGRMAEEGRARDQHVGTGGHHLCGVLGAGSAVHLG